MRDLGLGGRSLCLRNRREKSPTHLQGETLSELRTSSHDSMATGAVVLPPRYSVCRYRLDDAGCPLANLPAEPPSPASLAQAGSYGDTAMGQAQVRCSFTDYGDTTHLRRTSEFQFSPPCLGVCWRFAGI